MTNQEFIITNPSNQIMLSKSTSINNYILFFILLLIIGPSQGQQYEYLVITLAGGGGGIGTATGSSNGLGTYAKFYFPSGISSPDSNGNIYVADHSNNLIRKISR